MRLHTRTWGQGPRTLALVHGTASDSGTWHRLAPTLAGRGYQVTAVDLRGHGESPRGYYSPRTLAEDLADTLDPDTEVLLGHCFGGAVLSLAVPQLRPQRVIYAEPYWNAQGSTVEAQDALRRFKEEGRHAIAARNPRWTAADIDVEIAARSRWDDRTLVDLFKFDMPPVPDHATVPSLVLLAESPFLKLDSEQMQRQGFDVDIVPKTGHTLYHDNLTGFLNILDAWL